MRHILCGASGLWGESGGGTIVPSVRQALAKKVRYYAYRSRGNFVPHLVYIVRKLAASSGSAAVSKDLTEKPSAVVSPSLQRKTLSPPFSSDLSPLLMAEIAR